MVSAIEQKKQERTKGSSNTSGNQSSDILGFLRSLANWIIGIIIAIIVYISYTTAYYNYNNEEDLPTDPTRYPYAEPSMKQNVLHHAKRLKNMSKEAAKLMHKHTMDKFKGTKVGKHLERATKAASSLKENYNTVKRASVQRGGKSPSKVPYFYRKHDSYLSDWIADVLIYSWSSLRQNISEWILPKKSDNVSLEKLGFFSKALLFIFAPILVKVGAFIIVPIIGTLRTFYGVFGESPNVISLMIALFFVVFPFPILAPIFMFIAIVAGMLQGGWFGYFFGIKGFMNSKPGTFKETARNFTHLITIILAVGLISASTKYLSSGASQGVMIGAGIMILLALGDIARKLSSKSSPTPAK